ncbi:MAG TPA: hypothetical protein RMH85_02625 [Polyangiaceae bacterium LLY-WYZ-15_(1-7)]|nr:hypothetical protein [Myxococcales bacterium]MAT28155.1 hypothetical protein [Sandaracinus sp.]HJL04575.1 hypothetical protein [Polyangiaceae bacterium LLY-WYZ-15_(1-7)]HJL07357.1 hypothetical protein [Polyangiaceae bacterium LLY-WYZ-15_(1-7)]
MLLALGLGSASLAAQTPDDEPTEATAEPAPGTDPDGEILRDREGRRYRLVRPEAGPRRGRLPVPAWVVWAGGGALLLAAGVVLARRVAKRS